MVVDWRPHGKSPTPILLSYDEYFVPETGESLSPNNKENKIWRKRDYDNKITYWNHKEDYERKH